MVQRRVIGVLLAAVLVTGCSGGLGGAGPVPTVPESAPPPPPRLTEVPTEVGPAPTPLPDPPTPTTATPTPTSTATDAGLQEPDPADLGRSLGVAGMVELLAEDPDLAGERGPDLLRDLRRIAEGNGQVDRRIRDLQERIPDWVEDDELDPRIGTAALAALQQAAEDLRQGGRDDDDDDDD